MTKKEIYAHYRKMNCKRYYKIILQNNSESEEYEDLITNINVDAFRLEVSSMPGKCIVDFVYVLEQLHEKFNDMTKSLTVIFGL